MLITIFISGSSTIQPTNGIVWCLNRPWLFKGRIVLSKGSISIQWIVQLVSPVLIRCIVIYLLNSAIQCLNNQGKDSILHTCPIRKKSSITNFKQHLASVNFGAHLKFFVQLFFFVIVNMETVKYIYIRHTKIARHLYMYVTKAYFMF